MAEHTPGPWRAIDRRYGSWPRWWEVRPVSIDDGNPPITLAETARLAGVTAQTLLAWRNAGLLEAEKVGRRWQTTGSAVRAAVARRAREKVERKERTLVSWVEHLLPQIVAGKARRAAQRLKWETDPRRIAAAKARREKLARLDALSVLGPRAPDWNAEPPIDLRLAARMLDMDPFDVIGLITSGRLDGEQVALHWFTSLAAVLRYVEAGEGRGAEGVDHE